MIQPRIASGIVAVVASAVTVAWTGPISATATPGRHASSIQSPPAAAPANAILRREVFGFVNASNLGDPSVGYTSWDFRHLSTVAYFGIHVNTTDGGLIGNDTGWYVFHSSTMSSFVSTAHANGVRVIVSIIVHDSSTDPNNRTCTSLAPSVSQTTVSETVSEVQKAGIDGVNINYEGQLATCANGVTNRSELVDFARNMRAALPQGDYLSIDTYSGSAEDNQEFFDVTGLAPNVDSMFVMAYDMDWANYASPPLNCASYCFNPVSPLNTYQFNVTKSMQQYTALVSPSKVILGQPLYGSRGCVDGAGPAHQTLRSNYVNTTYIYASTIGSQTGVSQLTRHRDPSDGASEWDTWWDSDWNCWREQYFDDVVSLNAKYDVVNSMNLRGVGFFTLDYGGGASELWNLLDIKFATPTPWLTVGGVVTSGGEPASWGATRTDVAVRGTEGGLWDATWNGTSWSWTFLGGLITPDPAAVSWGSGRLDVFARGIDNALWHRSSDGTTWSPWEKLGGVLTSGPRAASWGTNRLDVFVSGSERGLWQVTWNGTSWSWHYVGGRITSDPAAVASSPNHLDVFARGLEGGLWQASWNGTSWTWTFLGGVLSTSPAAASCSAGHLDVYVTGTENGLWQRGFNGTSWSSWQYLRGQWSASPGAVCVPSTNNESIFERGPDSQLWQTTIAGT